MAKKVPAAPDEPRIRWTSDAEIQQRAYLAARKREALAQRERFALTRAGLPVPRRTIPEAEPGKVVGLVLASDTAWPGLERAAARHEGAALEAAKHRKKMAKVTAAQLKLAAAGRAAQKLTRSAENAGLRDRAIGMLRREFSKSAVARHLHISRDRLRRLLEPPGPKKPASS